MNSYTEEQFDVVLVGATSFVGQYVLERLINHPKLLGKRFALAGRNAQKLGELQARLGTQLPVLVGDVTDQLFANEIAQAGRVIISTVGPYALYGEPLVAAVANYGKRYCDLTGEPQWIKNMIDKYQDVAVQTGASLVNSSGFDSIPSDIGVFVLQNHMLTTFGKPASQIHYRFGASKGGFSGGTVASMLTALEQIQQQPDLARTFKTPYALVAKRDDLPYQPSVKTLTKDKRTGDWLLPFIMASINTKIVHRSNFLSGYQWQSSFLYDEAMSVGKGISGWLKGIQLVMGLGAFGLLASKQWGRKLLTRFVVPKPGQGPSDDTVRNGFFKVRLHGVIEQDVKATLTITGQGDPGYGSTSHMITEVAQQLLEQTNLQTGFITPATIGHPLVEGLSEFGQLTFTLKENE